MITYEINIICDGCGNKCWTSEPKESGGAADTANAWIECQADGWYALRGKVLCPECYGGNAVEIVRKSREEWEL